eukprot:2369338-Rhodomonas_salina.2
MASRREQGRKVPFGMVFTFRSHLGKYEEEAVHARRRLSSRAAASSGCSDGIWADVCWMASRREQGRTEAFGILLLFRSLLEADEEKTRTQIGNRSHAQLRALDALVASRLTYAGWRADVREAGKRHVKHPSLFDGILGHMKKTQSMHEGDRSHAQMRALDDLMASGLTYAAWQADVSKAEQADMISLGNGVQRAAQIALAQMAARRSG